jgi:hypothetical protein
MKGTMILGKPFSRSCRDRERIAPVPSGTLTVNAPPAGLVSVGGYRFALKELLDFVANAAEGSTLAALPDALAGHRLAGVCNDRKAVSRALTEQGAKPLIVEAFRERGGDRASAADAVCARSLSGNP